MVMRYWLAALFASTAALAQTEVPVGAVDAPPQAGFWRASDLIGHRVLSPSGETVGEIADVILDRDGRIGGYVVDVGGILGAGSRAVAVPTSALQLEPADMTATTGTVSGGLPASTPGGARTRADIQVSEVLTPGRIILTVPADQLRSAPPFARP